MKLINFTDLNKAQNDLILDWRNSDYIRLNMVNNTLITKKNHLSFIKSLETSTDKKYFLVQNEDTYIGVIYFVDISQNSCSFGLYANPQMKTQGVYLMNEALTYAFTFLKVEELKLMVRRTNIAAINLYEKFNFINVKTDNDYKYMHLLK